MQDKLIDLIIQFIQLFQIYTFVDQYERGVMLRCGKFHRCVGPGLRLMLPLGFERLISTNVKPEPMTFGVQSLHTSDDYAVNIQIAIIFQVVDERQYLIEIENPNAALTVVCSGVLAERVQGQPWKTVSSPDFCSELKKVMNRHAKKRGCQILEVHMQDCSAGAANRYWHEGIEINV